jgi:DNA-binding NtrC family response regulator
MNSEPYPRYPILLVDDEVALLRSFDNILQNEGMNNILRCSDSREVQGLLSGRDIQVVVLDLSMPHITGQEVLSSIVARHPDIPVIIVTAASEVETAVSCMKCGAFDYMVKPVGQHELVVAVTRAIEFRELRSENAQLKRHLVTDKLEHPEAFASMVTKDDKMQSLFMYVESIASSAQPAFITGETGVGKELMARSIHDLSGRTGKFVTVNVAGLDDNLFADTFFGHVKGAYTGADAARPGLAETAVGGTLFLDEIGDLSVASQVKLLRFLQEGEYLPLGADLPKRSDARVVVSTNRDVRSLLAQGKFREDLCFRLLSHHIRVPPLRERMEDLPLLVDHFLNEAASALGKKKPTPPRELITYLSMYTFPGNIRELKAMIHNAVSNHRSGMLSLQTFIEYMNQQQDAGMSHVAATDGGGAVALLFSSELPTLKQATILLIREALRRAGDNQVAAARLLDVSRQTVHRYAKEFDDQVDSRTEEGVASPPKAV